MNSWALIVKTLTEFYHLWIGKPSGYKSSNANQGNKAIIRFPIKWFTNKNDHNLFHNVSSYYHLANEDKLEMPTLSGTAFATPLLIQPTQVIIFQINLEFFCNQSIFRNIPRWSSMSTSCLSCFLQGFTCWWTRTIGY